MEIRYQYFENENLLVQNFSGLFSLDFYKKNIGKIYQEYSSKDIKKVIIDFRDLRFSETEDSIPDNFDARLKKIVSFRQRIFRAKQEKKDVKLVIWVDQPLPTAIAHLFVNSFGKKEYKYFTTEDKILVFMDLSPEFELSFKIKTLTNSLTGS